MRHIIPQAARITLTLALVAAACASPPPQSRPAKRSGIRKVAALCLKRDRAACRDAEARVAPLLRRQGFEAVAAGELFGGAPRPMDSLRQSRVDGIMGFDFPGDISEAGPIQRLRFKYYAVDGLTEPDLQALIGNAVPEGTR